MNQDRARSRWEPAWLQKPVVLPVYALYCVRHRACALLVQKRHPICESQDLGFTVRGQIATISDRHLDKERVSGVDCGRALHCRYKVNRVLLLNALVDQIL